MDTGHDFLDLGLWSLSRKVQNFLYALPLPCDAWLMFKILLLGFK